MSVSCDRNSDANVITPCLTYMHGVRLLRVCCHACSSVLSLAFQRLLLLCCWVMSTCQGGMHHANTCTFAAAPRCGFRSATRGNTYRVDADGILCTTQAMGSGRGDGERGQGYRKLWQQVCISCLSAAWHAQANPDIIHEHHCKPCATFWSWSMFFFS